MNESEQTICNRLERLRTEQFGDRGKSRMARELGIRPSTYDRYERDRVPPADLLVKIARVSNVTLEWLITGEGPRRPPQILDAESEELSRRFEEAISLDVTLRPAARTFLDWLDGRRTQPERTSQQFELPGQAIASQPPPPPQIIVDTSAGSRERERSSSGGSSSGGSSSGGAGEGAGRRDGGDSDRGEPRPTGGVWDDHTGSAASDSVAAAFETPDRGEDGGGLTSPSAMARALIPIVGRTSAGVLASWRDLASEPGPELDAQIVRLLERTETPIEFLPRPGEAESSVDAAAPGELPSQIQVIRLAGGHDADESLEFVQAAELKRIYPRAIAWQVDGDSMEPRYFHGDFVVTSVDQPAVEGQPCVVRVKDQVGVTCKVFHRDGENLMLIPINPRVNVERVPTADVKYATRVLYVVRGR